MEHKRFEEMQKRKEWKALKKLTELLPELFEGAFEGLPMWASAGYLYNISRGKDDENIDWARVNTLLNNNKSKYDFNAFDEVTSCEDFEKPCSQSLTSPVFWMVRGRGLPGSVVRGLLFHMTRLCSLGIEDWKFLSVVQSVVKD